VLAPAVNTIYTGVMAEKHEDQAMTKARALFEASGLSLHDLGLKMGYPPENARQSAWQFMKSGDPRVSTLRRFAAALGVPVDELIAERKGRTAKTKPVTAEEGSEMTICLNNDRTFAKSELRRFKSVLKTLGAELHASFYEEGEQTRLIAPVGVNKANVTTSAEKAEAVEHACRHFGFETSREAPSPLGSADIDMDLK
jgi:transcriptional regulator with XRE-family HTH domain